MLTSQSEFRPQFIGRWKNLSLCSTRGVHFRRVITQLMFSKDQSGIRAEHRLELVKSSGNKETKGEAAAVFRRWCLPDTPSPTHAVRTRLYSS